MQVHLLPPHARHGDTLLVEGPEARHIVAVLRHRPGDLLAFADGQGRFLHARIDRCTARTLRAVIERQEDDPRERGAPWLTLALALLKGDHFDLAVEKAVELGVHRIVPVATEHCVVRLDPGAAAARQQRWQRVAQSAMKQSGRSWQPAVDAPVAFARLVEAMEEPAAWIVGDEQERIATVADVLPPPPRPVVAVIGPEGGLSPAENLALRERGGRPVTLGAFRLRAETAAIALLAQIAAGRLRSA